MELKNLFNPKVVAVIGASRDPEKVGNVLMKNIMESGSGRTVIPINPSASEVLGKVSYKSIKDPKEKIDLAVIAVPAKSVMDSVKECNEKGVRDLIIVTSGFSEMGNKKTEEKLKSFLNQNKMRAVGVNCLGIYDAKSSLNALFIPKERMKFPKPGGISFVCQSGAIGLAIIDLAAARGYRFSKFISYGNATQLDESDYLEYLSEDKDTRVRCM
jgi:acetyltransferase